MRQRWLNLGGPAEHFQLLHGGHAANVAVCARRADDWRERVYGHDDARAVAVELASNGDLDVYQSQSGFRGGRRLNDAVTALPGLYVDLDHYGIPALRELDAEGLLDRALDALPWLPVPTMIVASGRGCYFAWLFPRPLTREYLARWQSVENVLVAALAPFGADAKVKDAARVLRVVGSINQHNGERVTAATNTGGSVEFERIERAVLRHGLPALRQEAERAAREAQPDRRTREASPAQRAQHLKPLQLAADRMADLRKLATMRGLPLGDYRSRLLFVYATAAAWFCGDVAGLRRELEGFAADCFRDGERYGPTRAVSVLERMRMDAMGIKRIWSGQVVPNRYRMRNRTIVALLDISDAEQRELKAIIGPGEAKNRRVARRRAAGMVDRFERADERRQAIYRLWRGGWKQAAIAAELGITQPAVSKVVAAIRRAAERGPI